MKKTGLHIILLLFCMNEAVTARTGNTIEIPLSMSAFTYMPQDSPTGSTPDPTDPNQFRASLTGNMLYVQTQSGYVSYVVVSETESEKRGEDYYFSISDSTVTCPITRAGLYIVRIGCWKTDFVGHILVRSFSVFTLDGVLVRAEAENISTLPFGNYIIYLNTSLGNTSVKICIHP